MAKFGFNDILNAKSKAAGAGAVTDYTEIWLNPHDVKPSEIILLTGEYRGAGRQLFSGRPAAAYGTGTDKRRVSHSKRTPQKPCKYYEP